MASRKKKVGKKSMGHKGKHPKSHKKLIKYARKKGFKKLSAKKIEKLIEKPSVNSKEIVDGLLKDETVTNYLLKNVSKRTPEIMRMLEKPQNDEKIAETLGMKINAVRRVLNILQGYGITDYKISKNENGWLQFEWSVNAREVNKFLDYVEETTNKNSVITADCNDYFICKNCYQDNKLVFTFDSAFEEEFKCSCGKEMARIDKDEAQRLVKESERGYSETKSMALF